MRIIAFLSVLLINSPLGWNPLSAQQLSRNDPGSNSAANYVVPPFQAGDSASFGAPSWGARVFSGLASAVVGAGLGYFASQVAQGDWDEGGGRNHVDRSAWAAVGGAGGFALGFSVPIWSSDAGGDPSRPFGNDQFLISGESIRENSLANAMEAVRFFHPEWLVQRGMDSFVDHTPDELRVYLDNAQLGGVDDLAGITSIVIREIRFFNGTQATARWGTGHAHGVIQVLTQD
jgi:hypothetical protein